MRESNPGYIGGNDVFYHWTTDDTATSCEFGFRLQERTDLCQPDSSAGELCNILLSGTMHARNAAASCAQVNIATLLT